MDAVRQFGKVRALFEHNTKGLTCMDLVRRVDAAVDVCKQARTRLVEAAEAARS